MDQAKENHLDQIEEVHSTGPKVDAHWWTKNPLLGGEVERPEAICDVCGEPAVGLACSSTGAVSFAYCAECLRENREPYPALVASMVGMENLNQVAEWYRPVVLSNLKAEGKTLEEFFVDTKKAQEDWEKGEEEKHNTEGGN